jgi:hypothetical protein
LTRKVDGSIITLESEGKEMITAIDFKVNDYVTFQTNYFGIVSLKKAIVIKTMDKKIVLRDINNSTIWAISNEKDGDNVPFSNVISVEKI